MNINNITFKIDFKWIRIVTSKFTFPHNNYHYKPINYKPIYINRVFFVCDDKKYRCDDINYLGNVVQYFNNKLII